TKYLGGHSDVLLGAVICRDPETADRLREFRTRTGIVGAPDPAYLPLRALPRPRARRPPARVSPPNGNRRRARPRLPPPPRPEDPRGPRSPPDRDRERDRTPPRGASEGRDRALPRFRRD